MGPSKSSTVGRFLHHVVPAVLRPLHVLWNEIIGFIFIALAIPAVFSLVRGWQQFSRGETDFTKVLLPGIWAVVMGYFGISSFLRARKISRP